MRSSHGHATVLGEMSRWLLVLIAACGEAHTVKPPSVVAVDAGPHRDAVAAQVKPLIDAEVVSGIVVGLYDSGKREIYGFGTGPNGTPDGATLYELGAVTKVYTGLLLAEAVQRKEVDIDGAIADLVPPGVTVPTKDRVAITLKHLALHSSGLPRLPPSLATRSREPDPYASYDDNALYRDLTQTELEATPGTQIVYSNFGAGLLGFLLGKKAGGGYDKVLRERVLAPLGLADTFIKLPAPLAARRATGGNDDLAPVSAWSWGALAGAGAIISSARDQLTLIEAELDAAAGGKSKLRHAMRLSQEPALDRAGDNEGLGWMIDSAGRYWHSGGTGGYHSFVGFDPKTKRGVVILASTASALVDRLSDPMYKILDGSPPAAPVLATPEDLAAFAGHYDFANTKLDVVAAGKRLYLQGPGEPRHRMAPFSDHEFWIEALQSTAIFDKQDGKVVRLLFGVGDHVLVAPRLPDQ